MSFVASVSDRSIWRVSLTFLVSLRFREKVIRVKVSFSRVDTRKLIWVKNTWVCRLVD